MQQGLEQGLEQGLQQGEVNATTKMVLNAHQIGLPIRTIIDLTGLREDEIAMIVQNK